MKESLQVGVERTQDFEIDKERTITFMGEEMRIYSTPSMVGDIEATCWALCQEHLDEGEETVGAHVSVDHLGASLLNMTVTVTAHITELDGRRITLEAKVHDGIDLAGESKHVRFVIDRDRQRMRLEKKRTALAGL